MIEKTANNVNAQACALLLRSPHLSVSQILELMDISDAEFREMLKSSAAITTLLDQRREGELEPMDAKLTECPACNDWFVPYGSARHCSDECAKVNLIRNTPDPARRLRLKNARASS